MKSSVRFALITLALFAGTCVMFGVSFYAAASNAINVLFLAVAVAELVSAIATLVAGIRERTLVGILVGIVIGLHGIGAVLLGIASFLFAGIGND